MKWLRNLFAVRLQTRQNPRPRIVPRLEALENRELPSVTPLDGYAVSTLAGPTADSVISPYTPSQIRHAYGIDGINFGGVAGNGSGQTIAIIDAYYDPFVLSDLQTFDRQMGLPDPPNFNYRTFTWDTDNGGWFSETALDVEWAHAVAPGANILLVEANSDTNADLFGAVDWARQQPGVSVVSMSFGTQGGFLGENAYDSYFTTPAGHNGVTFVAAAGDHGSPGGYPALSPNVLAVGGTSLYLNGSNYGSETVWNDGNDSNGTLWATGGGVSLWEARPAYQDGLAYGLLGVATPFRGVPDVAFDADGNTGVWEYVTGSDGSGSWIESGGTSLAAPCWAGLIAIADQGRALRGLGTLDGASQTLPMLYQLPASDFHSDIPGNNGTCSYQPGYDLCTGLGTPIANLLVPDLAGYPRQVTSRITLTTSAATATEGQSVTFQADVADSGSLVPTGTVTFYDGNMVIGTASLQPSVFGWAGASITVSTLGVGSHTITAIYNGDGNFKGNMWAPVTETIVNPAYVVAEIPGTGVWRHSTQNGWQQLTPANASQVAVDSRGDVVAEIPGTGVWRYENATGWQRLTTADASQVGIAGNGIVAIEIPGTGVWRFEDSSGWQWLTPADASQISVAGNGIVAVEIPGTGVWRFEDATGWRQLTPADASQVAVDANGDVAVVIPSAGVWRYEDATGWEWLTTAVASHVSIAGNGIVAAEIPGTGVWRFEEAGGWMRLTTADASQVAVDSNGDVAAEIPGDGVWLYQDGLSWGQLTASDALEIGLGA